MASDGRCGCRGREALRLFWIRGPQKGRCDLCGGKSLSWRWRAEQRRFPGSDFRGLGKGWSRRTPLMGVGLKRGRLPVSPTSMRGRCREGWCREGRGSGWWDGAGGGPLNRPKVLFQGEIKVILDVLGTPPLQFITDGLTHFLFPFTPTLCGGYPPPLVRGKDRGPEGATCPGSHSESAPRGV